MIKNSDKASIDYLEGMKYQDIADKYGVSLSTVKSWKQRYSWERKKGTRTKVVKVHTKPKTMQSSTQDGTQRKKAGAPIGNKNAVGNSGGGAPMGNKNALTHGLYAKYLPKETLEIVMQLQNTTPLAMQWEAICIKYAAILRTQKIMNAEDVMGQETFLNAQSRAMGTLNQMIKQYEEMKPDGESALRCEKLKKELSGSGEDALLDRLDRLLGNIPNKLNGDDNAVHE